MITYKKLSRSEVGQFLQQVLGFYASRYKHQFNETTLENSATICLAYDGDRIIGAVRAISDMTRHAMIVDLIVDTSYRKQKIGTGLLQLIIEELKSHNVKNIGLTTEPGVDWLVGFYQKNEFKPLSNSTYLQLES